MLERKRPLPEGMLAVGRITGCYGIRGWLKVQSYTEAPLDLMQFQAWWLESKEALKPVVLDAGRMQGKGLVVHLRGVDDRNDAENLRGQVLFVRASELPGLEDDEYYWHQLEGLQVWCRDSRRLSANGPGETEVLLGRVDHLIETGANDVLVVAPCEGSIDMQERLIPYLPDDVVSTVDLAGGRLTVDWFVDD